MRLILTAAALSLMPLAAVADVVPFDDQWEEQRFPFQKGNEYMKEGNTLDVTSEGGVSLMYRRTPDLSGARRRIGGFPAMGYWQTVASTRPVGCAPMWTGPRCTG